MTRTIALASAVAFVLAYSTWIVLPVLDPALSLSRAFVSEYGATTRPGALLLRAGDTTAAVLLLILTFVLVRLPLPGPRALRLILPAGLVLASLGTLLDVAFPMPCAPSASAACAAAERAGTLGFARDLHTVGSCVVGVGLSAAALATLFMWHHWWVRVLSILVPVSITVSAIFALLPQPSVVGLIQRVSLVIICAWVLTVVGLAVRRQQ